MNLEQAKREFLEYTSKYDKKNSKIERKIGHSIRVMEISTKIAEDLNLTKEQIEIATLIGLLHDIGRFEQIRIYNTYKDHKSIDHGDLGKEILEKDNYIRKYIQEDNYDEIILKAIKNHNKYVIEDGLTDEQMLFAKIIRDADKLDIFYEGVEMFWKDEQEKGQIQEDKVSKETMDLFRKEKLFDRSKTDGSTDRLISFLAFTFDINFKCSYKMLKDKDYINKILDKFDFKDEDTKKNFEEIREISNKYISTHLI